MCTNVCHILCKSKMILSIQITSLLVQKRKAMYGNNCKGPFTESVCVYNCDMAYKWVPFISMVLFTLSDAKHQRKKSQTQTQSLTVNGVNTTLTNEVCESNIVVKNNIKWQRIYFLTRHHQFGYIKPLQGKYKMV